MILITKTSDQTRQRDTHSLLVQFLLELWVPCSLPLLPCYSLEYLSWKLLDQPFLFYVFSSFHPTLPRFPHGVCVCVCACKRESVRVYLVFIKLHITAQSGPATLVILCHSHWSSLCVCVCVCVYLTAYNHASRPCLPSDSMLLALAPRGDR